MNFEQMRGNDKRSLEEITIDSVNQVLRASKTASKDIGYKLKSAGHKLPIPNVEKINRFASKVIDQEVKNDIEF
ncbi:hypothetical protein [Anaerococcus degeneri]|jgi:hypothetical protein|uniref:hypothetical protein n=1 Tax=Anaerococcus degeneri TaxID=361500 RepID=UPI001AEA99A2|nr:hypothetical protein [Anaerococcus degeneri]MBP2016609.1 hypothetical protein [Anaerococcus degeneri]